MSLDNFATNEQRYELQKMQLDSARNASPDVNYAETVVRQIEINFGAIPAHEQESDLSLEEALENNRIIAMFRHSRLGLTDGPRVTANPDLSMFTNDEVLNGWENVVAIANATRAVTGFILSTIRARFFS